MPLPIQTLSISPQVKPSPSIKELAKPSSGKEAFSRHLQEAAAPAAKDKLPNEPAVNQSAPKEKSAFDSSAEDLTKDEPDGTDEAMVAIAAPIAPQANDTQGEAGELLQNVLGDAYDVQLQAGGQQSTELDPLAGILEGSAKANQPEADARIDFQALMQSEGDAPGRLTDDPAQDAQAVDAMARMPKNAELTQQELEEWGVTIQPGSLENADEQIPPPSRVQISQISGEAAASASQGEQTNAITPRAVPMAEEGSQPSFNASLAAQAEPVFVAESIQPEAPAVPTLPFEQIALEATLQQGLGKDQFIMRLKPESLGEVTVRLVMQSDGVVARITVANEAARTALAEQLYQLGDSMREKGVIVRSVELVQDYAGQSAMLHDGNQSPAGQGQSPRWKRARAQSPAEAVAAIEGYDSTLIAQITYVGEESQSVTIDA